MENLSITTWPVLKPNPARHVNHQLKISLGCVESTGLASTTQQDASRETHTHTYPKTLKSIQRNFVTIEHLGSKIRPRFIWKLCKDISPLCCYKGSRIIIPYNIPFPNFLENVVIEIQAVPQCSRSIWFQETELRGGGEKQRLVSAQ